MIKHRGLSAFLLLTTLLACAGCGAVILGGGAAAVGTYAYVNGQATGTFDASIAQAFDASIAACGELGVPVVRKVKDGSSGEIRGKLSGDSVTITLKLVGDGLTEISARVGMWGNESASRRILSAISQRL